MPDPLTKVAHKWVVIEITDIDVYRRSNGEITAIKDPESETKIRMGCEHCNASPEKGWYNLCPGANDG